MSETGMPAGGGSSREPGRDEPVPPSRPASANHRPRIVDEPGILGLSRVSRSRFGSRVFTWFFVLVFALIIVQMVVALMTY